MKTPLIAIGAPIRNREFVLPDYLSALEAIEHDAKEFVFVLDESTDGTEQIVHAWATASPANVALYYHRCLDAPGHKRSEYGRRSYEHLAKIRNILLDLFLETDAQYLLSIDSDVIAPPYLLRHLLPLADERTIVAAAISNIAGKPLDGQRPGNFLVNEGGLLRHPASYPLSGTMEVDVTGACAIYPRALFEAGIRWGPNSQGEDVYACQAAKAAGFRILVNFNCRPEHRMLEPVEAVK